MDAMGRLIVGHGGLVATHELHSAGFPRDAIATAVRTRRLLRVRQGWYAAPGTHPQLLAAVRVGGRATCLTALALHRIWVPHADALHVACPAHGARLRTPRDSRVRISPADGVRVHWRDLPESGSRLIVEPLDALADSLSCLDDASILPTADSVLHRYPQLRRAWQGFCASAPTHRRTTLRLADGVCESGIETMTWIRIRDLTEVRRQVLIPGVGRVDFLLGERCVVEVDGEEYHTDPTQFEDDRRRDATLAALGFVTLRFSYRQVTGRWHEVRAAIDGVVARGLHRT